MQNGSANRSDDATEAGGLDTERLPCRRCGDLLSAGSSDCPTCGFAPRRSLVVLGAATNAVGFALSLAGVETAVGAPVALLGVLVVGFALIARPTATSRPDGDPWYSRRF